LAHASEQAAWDVLRPAQKLAEETAIPGQMTDTNNAVRYSAAAAVIRLSTLGELSKLQPALLQGPSQEQ
jgi:hypothetical protein